ncbi:Piezo-type mechanosensitive ion channel protein [Chloropicon primus]|uniref:Piezo-type mechanosensitive ion channel protein n=2 Tax=Chloropicon primus TaxID=1764295 RepID=A0A5B8MC66_9CHLO|nr:Piezo-type mechanosensitive ion channel protein [Chloropicon primus]UPQ97178.1 Piezo-type mechanosensitive ion channel protein [Chloropicon primus]|eukprot:QDZ17963.1 Piezo-type mechanosensitive ion channel protein [Chloropicon primus]
MVHERSYELRQFGVQHRRIAKVKGVFEHFFIEVASGIRRAMERGNISSAFQSVVPIFLLAAGATIPAAVQSLFYLCCLFCHFRFLVWSNASDNCGATARRALRLWTLLLGFSFGFLTMEILAQVALNLDLSNEGDTLDAVLRVLGLCNRTAERLILALFKHFLVLFVSTWQRGMFLSIIDEEDSTHAYPDLLEIKKSCIKFAEKVATHVWPLVLLSLCLLKITPLNLPYVAYMTAYSFYTGSKIYGAGKRTTIKGIKIGYMFYSSLHYVFLLVVRVGSHFSSDISSLADKTRLSFLCREGSFAITTLYIADLVFALLLGLFEFSIEKYPKVRGEGLREPLLPRDGADNGESEKSEDRLERVDPYAFHWCTGWLFCLYALLLNKMIGFLILLSGLLILIVPRRESLCKAFILASAFYMSFLWLAVYLIVSSSTCSRPVEGLGLCDGRSKNVNRFFETHLLSILPIFSILVMKQVRLYQTDKARNHWIHCVYDACNGYLQLMLGTVSCVLVPLTWTYLAVFCQPDNDVLHSLYIVVLVVSLVFRMDVLRVSKVLAAFHILVVFLTKKLFFGEGLLNFKCERGSITAIINSCVLSNRKYTADMLLLLSLVLATSVDRSVVEEKGRLVVNYFKCIFASLKAARENFLKVSVYVCGRSLGWCLTLLLIMLLVHLENLKGMKNSLIQVLWTIVCILNLVFSNFSGTYAKKAKGLLRLAIPTGAVVHLLTQFTYAAFYRSIYKVLPDAKKTASFIEDDVGLSRDTSSWHLIVSIVEPIAIMLLMRLYSFCNAASSGDAKLESPSFRFIQRLAIVHLDKMLAFTVFLFAVNLNTVLGTLILLCYLISLHRKPYGFTALCLLRSCEILTCITLVAAEALYVPCVSRSLSDRMTKLINFVCCGNQKGYFITSWLSLAILSLSKITVQHRTSHTLGEFVTSWPSALNPASREKRVVAKESKAKEEPQEGQAEKKDYGEAKRKEKIKLETEETKWKRLKNQLWYLELVTPFHIERAFANHGSGICSLVFLLCAFYAKNIISIVYVCFILISVRKSTGRKAWEIISIICTVIALYQDTLAILETHEILVINGISKEWVYWLSLKPTKQLIWTCMIAAFFSCMKSRYDRFGESVKSEREKLDQHHVKFFDHGFWSEISFSGRKRWTTLEYVMYGFFRYSQDISLVFVVSLAFYDKDVIHLGYLFLSLYFFRQREALRKRKNRFWVFMVGFNLTIISLNVIYQMPVFRSTSKENTCNVQNLIGLYKITGLLGNSIRTVSMRPITSILLFVVLQIQANLFRGRIHVAVTSCGMDVREYKQNYIIKLQHRKMLLKKFKVEEAYKNNESRKQRLKWLRKNVLQKETTMGDDEGHTVTAITGGSPEKKKENVEEKEESEELDTPATRKRSHTRSTSDLPEQMFLTSAYGQSARPSEARERARLEVEDDDEPGEGEEEGEGEGVGESSNGGREERAEIVETVIPEEEADESKAIVKGENVDESSHEIGIPPELLMTSFWQKLFVPNRTDSHNFFCYFCMCLFFISEFSILSMIFPALIFYYSLLVESPSKNFWKFALALMEVWLLGQYVWQIPIYNSGISSDNVSICLWVSERASLKILQVIGLHESAARCFPGFLLYLSCLFHFFSLESKIVEVANEEEYSGSRFSLIVRKVKLFYLRLCTYHEDSPSFVHFKVKGKKSSLAQLSNVEWGMGLTVFLKEKMAELSYTTCTPHIKVLGVERDGKRDEAVILGVVDTPFNFESNDGLLIQPGRTIAKLVRRTTGEKLFDPWRKALEAQPNEEEIPKSLKSGVTLEDAFAAHEEKPDLYVYTVLMDLFAYIFVLCLYQVAVSSNKSLSESLNESIFPADYIVTMLGLFLFLVADRAVYVIASNRARTLLHYVSVPAYFAGGMLMYWQRAPEHPSYTCIFMFVKCFSLALQSWQLQAGYPKSTSGSLLLRHYNTISWLGVVIYTAIPFLYELRCLLDWTCTATTLTLFDWLTFEEIRLMLYRAEMVKQFKSRRKFGNSQPKHVKFFQGLLLFILLLIVLWTPLLVFSSGSPSFQVPVLKGLDMNVTLLTGDLKLKQPWTRPSQAMPLFKGGNNRLITEAEYSPTLISKYFYYQQLQCLAVAPESNQMWMASEPSKSSFASDLVKDDKLAYISVSWSMIRDHPVSASMCASTIYAQLDGPTRVDLSLAINQSSPSNTTDVRIPLKLLDPRTKQSIPGVYRLYWQLNGSPCAVVDRVGILQGNDPWVRCSLVLHTQVDKTDGFAFKSQWWDMECDVPQEGQDDNKTDSCWDKGSKSSRGKNGPLLKAILQEVQSGVIGTFLSSKGITGLYITFVFLIGRGVRAMVSNRILQIPQINLPSIVKLRTLCDDVRDARTVFDLELEELLYKALIRIYRSTELLYEMTRKME